MSRPRTYQTEAIIIRKTRLGEADRVLTMYTPGLGKLEAVARGVRRTKSKLAGHLEVLTYSVVSLARGHNLDVITGSQTVNSFLPLKSDLQLTSFGLYASELVDRFTASGAEDPALFAALKEALERLCETGRRELVVRCFEMQLLTSVGYRPQLRQCLTCHEPLQPVVNYFCPGAGGMLCPDCARDQHSSPVSVNAQKLLRLLQNNDFDTLCRVRISDDLHRELETVIREYLRYLLERDLKSTAWLDMLRQPSSQPAPVTTPVTEPVGVQGEG